MDQNVKCYICFKSKKVCLCECISPVSTKIRFIILIHPMEFRKEKNGTGRLTNLQLKNSLLIDGISFDNDSRVDSILGENNSISFLLYPGIDSINISNKESASTFNAIIFKKKVNVFILDGTWPCAKKMLKSSKNLQNLPKISFSNNIKSKFIIKQQPNALCLSTIESTHVLLGDLCKYGIENVNLDNFLNPFYKMIENQIEYIQNPPPGSYRKGNGKVLTKTKYKTKEARNFLFGKNILK